MYRRGEGKPTESVQDEKEEPAYDTVQVDGGGGIASLACIASAILKSAKLLARSRAEVAWSSTCVASAHSPPTRPIRRP